MKKKTKILVDLIILIVMSWLVYDKDIPIIDNIAMSVPFIFIYGLMYLILR